MHKVLSYPFRSNYSNLSFFHDYSWMAFGPAQSLLFAHFPLALSSTEERALLSLAKLWMIGNRRPLRSMLQMMIGLKHPVSVDNLLREMDKKGLVQRPCPASVELAATALELPGVKNMRPPVDNVEHHTAIKGLLGSKQIDIFDVLSDGRVHTRKEVAEILGYPSHVGNFQNRLSPMSNLGIISYPSSKEVQLTDMCFIHSPTKSKLPDVVLVDSAGGSAAASAPAPVNTKVERIQSTSTQKATDAKKTPQAKQHALETDTWPSKMPPITKKKSPPSGSSTRHGRDVDTLKKRYLRLLLNFHSHYSPGHPRSPSLHPMILVMLAGNKCKTSKIVAEALKQLTEEDLVFFEGKGSSRSVHLTRTGVKRASALGSEYVPNNTFVLKRISAVLTTDAERKMLDALKDRSSRPRADVARAMGYTCTGTKKFTETIKVLKSKGLLHFPKGSTGKLQLTDACFPFGKDDDDATTSSVAVSPDDAAYDAETDVESAVRKHAAVTPGNDVGTPASAIDLTYSDEDSDWKPEDDCVQVASI